MASSANELEKRLAYPVFPEASEKLKLFALSRRRPDLPPADEQP